MEDKTYDQFNEQGKPIGVHRQYWGDGTPRTETRYNDIGQLDGPSFEWKANGEPKNMFNYKNGKIDGPATIYLEAKDGHQYKYEDCLFKDGKLDGILKTYHENGEVGELVSYKDGKRDGLYTSFYSNGNVHEVTSFKDDKINGLYQSYYSGGQRKKQGIFKDNWETGTWKTWDDEGHLVTEANYKDGRPDGLYKAYDTNGNIVQETNYKDGHIVCSVIIPADETAVNKLASEMFDKVMDSEQENNRTQGMKL